MNKPTDYPVQADTSKLGSETAQPADITYAVLKDRVEAKQPVTDEMIRIARTKLDAAHAAPATPNTESVESKFKLSGIRNRFRQN